MPARAGGAGVVLHNCAAAPLVRTLTLYTLQAAENYDWRLSIVDLERRDHYFTVLRNRVELLHQMNGEKARPARSAFSG